MPSGLQQEHALIEYVLIAIRQVAGPVDDEKLLPRLERDQRHVPGAALVIHALPAIGYERLQVRQLDALSRWRDDDHETGRCQRHERLAAERMTFDDIKSVRQLRRTA